MTLQKFLKKNGNLNEITMTNMFKFSSWTYQGNIGHNYSTKDV